MDEVLQPWQRAWREVISHQLPTEGLKALAEALRADSPELIREMTAISVTPWNDSATPAGACPIGFALWRGKSLQNALQIDRAFSRIMAEARMLGDDLETPILPQEFTGWWDRNSGRGSDHARLALLSEVEKELQARNASVNELQTPW